MSTARPILMSAPMVKALLAGTKTQTRRVMKTQPEGDPRPLSEWSSGLAAACGDGNPDPKLLRVHSEGLRGRVFPFTTARGGLVSYRCPYGAPGDLLWVRETWAQVGERPGDLSTYIRYKADEQKALGAYGAQLWRPSIFMPRKHSRLTLRITEVRVQRLHDITDAEAIAEGVERCDNDTSLAAHTFVNGSIHCDRYARLWDQINGEGSWAGNAWVWALTFEVLQKNVDEVLQ